MAGDSTKNTNSKDGATTELEVDPTSENVSQRSWHWHCTPKTTANLEFSVLAIVESVLSVGVYIWLALNGYTLHLVASACIAPLLLLRTQESTEFALKFGEPIVKKVDGVNVDLSKLMEEKLPFAIAIPLTLPVLVMTAISIGISFFVIKFIATIIHIFKSPLRVLLAIPVNWWRIVGCLDIFHSPETLPGYISNREKSAWRNEDYVLPTTFLIVIYRDLKAEDTIGRFFGAFIYPVFVVPFLIFIILPAYLYRWSLKGSAVIYLPLLWVVHTFAGGEIGKRLRGVKDLSFHKLRRWFGVLVIAILLSKVFLFTYWEYIYQWGLQADPYGFVALFVAPLELPRWQIASALNGLFAWIVLFIAEAALHGKDQEPSLEVGKGYTFAIRVFWLLGSLLTLYTVSILIYNAMTLQWGMIPIGENWFPWQQQVQSE